MKRYLPIVMLIIVVSAIVFAFTYTAPETERVVIDLPVYEVQPVRSYGERVGDEKL